MKLIIPSLALIATVLVSPCAAQTVTAQTGTTPGSLSPQATRALAITLFRNSGSGHSSLTPQQRARVEAVRTRISGLEQTGAKALRAGDYAAAEADFRESISISPEHSTYYELGEALVQQGRSAEAMEAYREGIYGPPFTTPIQNDIPIHGQFNPNIRTCPGGGAEVPWMKYALLLSQMGQGAEAVVIYKKALPEVPEANHPGMSLALDTDTPEPEAFQAAAHVALGLCATWVFPDHDKAMTEFDAARRLRPTSPLTNYYYGYGWQRLDPKGAAKQGSAVQAKAALQQAAASGGGEVKKAAEEALTGFK